MTTSDLAETEPTTEAADAAGELAGLDYTGTFLGLTFTARAGGGTFMTTASGEAPPVPPDLPHKIARYQNALEIGRSINAAMGSVFLPELREVIGYVQAAHANNPYAPGAELHEHAVIVAALEAFAATIEQGRAASRAATTAAAEPVPAPAP